MFDESSTLLPLSDPTKKNTIEPIIENPSMEDNVEVRRTLPMKWRYASSHPKRKFLEILKYEWGLEITLGMSLVILLSYS